MTQPGVVLSTREPNSTDFFTYEALDLMDHSQEANGATARESQPSLIHGDSIGEDEARRLAGLATEVRDQDELQRDVFRQADQQLTEQANERDQKRLDKTTAEKSYVVVLL